MVSGPFQRKWYAIYFRRFVVGIVDNKFNFKYSLYIYDIYDFDFRSLEGTWKEKMAKCFRNVACFVSGKIPEFQFNSKNFIIKGVKQDEYNLSSNKWIQKML